MFLHFPISKRLILSFLLFYLLITLVALFQWGDRDRDRDRDRNESKRRIFEEPETKLLGKNQRQRNRNRRSLIMEKQNELRGFKMKKKNHVKSSASSSTTADFALLHHLAKIQKDANASSIRDGLMKYPAYPKPWRVINMTVSYLLNNYDLCGDPRRDSVYMLLIIHSRAGNVHFRNALRSGLLKHELEEVGLRRLFVLANPDSEPSQTEKYDLRYESTSLGELLKENSQHSDMIIGDFHDTYRNLTYKHIMALEWAKRYCAHTKYILKQDDDAFVDYYQILTLLRLAETPRKSLNDSVENERTMSRIWKELENSTEPLVKQKLQMVTDLTLITQYGDDPRFIVGNVNYQIKPRRNENQDWYVTRKEWPRRLYPDYVPGFAYITNIATVLDLVWKSRETVYFWIDDIFVTGVLRSRAKIPLKNVKYLFSMNAHRELDLCSSRVDIPSFTHDDYNFAVKMLQALAPNLMIAGQKLPPEFSTKIIKNSSSSSSMTQEFAGKWCSLLAGVRAKKKLIKLSIPFMNHARLCYRTNLCTFIQNNKMTKIEEPFFYPGNCKLNCEKIKYEQ